MFTFRSIGYVRSPYTDTNQVPKGPGTQHQAEGVLEIVPEFEKGLLDIEGFSHLFIIWVFDRSEGYELTGIPPTDDRPHGVFATRSPYRPAPLPEPRPRPLPRAPGRAALRRRRPVEARTLPPSSTCDGRVGRKGSTTRQAI